MSVAELGAALRETVVALEIWYDQDTANDLGEGDPAIVVATPDELGGV